MNRIVLIGNGFDLAHGLKTSYADFIYWYWEQRVNGFVGNRSNVSEDPLCKFVINDLNDCWNAFAYQQPRVFQKIPGIDVIQSITSNKERFDSKLCPFFERINKSIKTKGWVDIENEYYELLKQYALEEKDETKVKQLNDQLHFLQNKLIEYLTEINKIEVRPIKSIQSAIYHVFDARDMAISGMHLLQDHIDEGLTLPDEEWERKLNRYGESSISSTVLSEIKITQKANRRYLSEKEKFGTSKKNFSELKSRMDVFFDYLFSPEELLLPNEIMLLNFNYTKTAEMYCQPHDSKDLFPLNHIHGVVERPESVIFGYGDEMDEKYKELVKKNDNHCLGNIKSIKYLESDKYRKVLSFIESEPYQILIMGHSCGNSDRTLLNTLFEHDNCVSIKPYYYINDEGKDNYIDIVQNISRNFNDMKLMRDRVVNKLYCKPLTKKDSQESDQ